MNCRLQEEGENSGAAVGLRARMRGIIKKFKQLQGSPSYLARGVAIGVFIGIAPLMPLKTLLILAITFIFPCSTIATFLTCAIICNPLTYLVLYYLSWLIGSLLLPGRSSWSQIKELVIKMQEAGLVDSLGLAFRLGLDTGIVILVGGCLLALPLALISYPIAFRFFAGIAKRRQERHLLKDKQS